MALWLLNERWRLIISLIRKTKSFISLSFVDQLFFPLVWLLLGMARIVILFVPFRAFSSWLGVHSNVNVSVPDLSIMQTNRAKRLGVLVKASAKVTPWKSECFPRALVACFLLRLARIPYVMHFGLAKNTDTSSSDPMKAHAWVVTGRVLVTGGDGSGYKVVASYVSPLLCGHESDKSQQNG